MIYNIHLLRAVAALVVVYYHIASRAGLDLPFESGAFGVDIFFVISGFIIAYIGSKQPQAFFRRRLIRVVPFYWSASIAIFCIALAFPTLLRQTRPDLPHLLYSLYFIPHETDYSGMYPTLILGWTLNYEMYFYVLFALGLALSPRRAPLVCCSLLLMSMSLIVLSGTHHPTLLFYAEPIVFEFIFGIAVYYITRAVRSRWDVVGVQPWLKPLLLVIVVGTFLFLLIQDAQAHYGMHRFLMAGVPAFILVLSAILLEQGFGFTTRNRTIFLLGESSYILYLIHPYIVYGIIRLFIGSVAGWHPLAIGLLVAGLLLLPSVIAVYVHLWFEKPVMKVLREKLIPVSVPSPRIRSEQA